MTGEKILGYTVNEKIRSDVYGSVYKASTDDGADVKAIRHITVPTEEQYHSIQNAYGGKTAKVDAYIARMMRDVENELTVAKSLSQSAKEQLVQYYDSNIVKIGEHTYNVYVLMDNLMPFSEYAEQTSLTVKDVIKLGKDVLAGLRACHSEKLFHRGINETTVFVDENGKFKLGGLDVPKAVKGSPIEQVERENRKDIAPELYLGKRFDMSVDIYALGMMLYRLLNRLRNPLLPTFPEPYTRTDEDVAFERRLHGAIVALPYGADNILGEVVRKAIMPRAERYNTADEFLQALEDAEKVLAPEYLDTPIDALEAKATKDVVMESPVAVPVAVPVEENTEEIAAEEKQTPPKALPEDKTPVGIPEKDKKLTGSKLKTLLVCVAPVVFAALFVCFYMVLVPLLYENVISFTQWLFADVDNIVSLVYPDIDELLGATYITIGLVVLHYVLLAGVVGSLFIMGKYFHDRKRRPVMDAIYCGREPYFNLVGACVKFEKTRVEELVPIAKTVRNAAEALKFAADFGECSDKKIIAAETEIGQMIDKLPNLIEQCLAENTQENRKRLSDVAYALGAKIQMRNQLLVK